MLFPGGLEFREFQNNRRSRRWSEYSQAPDRSQAHSRNVILRKETSSRRADRNLPALLFRLPARYERSLTPVSHTNSAACLLGISLQANRGTSTKCDPTGSLALCASQSKNPLPANLLPQAAAAPAQFPVLRRCPANVAVPGSFPLLFPSAPRWDPSARLASRAKCRTPRPPAPRKRARIPSSSNPDATVPDAAFPRAQAC